MKAVSFILPSSTIPVQQSPHKAACHGIHSQTAYVPWVSYWPVPAWQGGHKAFSHTKIFCKNVLMVTVQTRHLIWFGLTRDAAKLVKNYLSLFCSKFITCQHWLGRRSNKRGWRELFYRGKLLKSLQKSLNCKFIKMMKNETTVLFTKHYRAAVHSCNLAKWEPFLSGSFLLTLLRTQFLVMINTNGFSSTLPLGRH